MSAILKKRAPLALAVALAIFCAASPLAERRESHAASSSVDKVVMAGDPAPGGGTFSDFYGWMLGSDGRVAFLAALSSGEKGIFVASVGQNGGFEASAVAVTGEPAPGGGTFSDFYPPSINSAGMVAFTAPSTGIFVASPTPSGFQVSRVVIIGDADPLGGSFRSFGPISLNDVGDVGFTPGSGAGAIYSASPNIVGGYDVRLVDLSPFVVCDSRLSLNNSHQVAFLGGNSSGGCGAPNYVIGLSSPNGTQGVAYYSNPPFILHFGPPSLNDARQVAFTG